MSDGIPIDLFDCVKISGTTHASANTQMGTMVVNRYGHTHVKIKGLVGEATYLEDGGVSRETIDVRSRVSSAPFMAYVFILNESKIPDLAA